MVKAKNLPLHQTNFTLNDYQINYQTKSEFNIYIIEYHF